MEECEEGALESLFPYPNTCEECEDRGQFRIFEDEKPIYHGSTLPDNWDNEEKQRWRRDRRNVHDYTWQNSVWPKRCKSCNTRAAAYKRARKSVARLEELREFTMNYFEEEFGKHQERWCYLKFVTLTWRNELTTDPVPNMKKARSWLRRKRDKIIDKLDCVAGTDVMECVTSEVDGLYHHHVHMHGIWIMPYHDIEFVGEVMKKYVGRDQCRAIKPIWIESDDHPNGGYEMSAFAQARNYLVKYLSKQPNTRRSLWGFARKSLGASQFYETVDRIFSKWESTSKAVA